MISVESQSAVRSAPVLPLTTHLGPVRIAVTNRDNALAIWRDVVGPELGGLRPRRDHHQLALDQVLAGPLEDRPDELLDHLLAGVVGEVIDVPLAGHHLAGVVGFGALAIGWPLVSRDFVTVLALWAATTGLLEILMAALMPRQMSAHWLIGTAGVLSVFLAVLVFMVRHADSPPVVELIAGYTVGFGMLLGLGENAWPLMVVSSLVAGTAQACGNSIGQALKADVIDLDELRTGERKEGAYFAAWSFVNKLGNAILASSAGFALGLTGYEPNVEQTPLVKYTMVFLLGGMPLLGYGIGALAFGSGASGPMITPPTGPGTNVTGPPAGLD